MLTGLDHSELLAENLPTVDLEPASSVVQELTHLAMTQDELPFLAAEMFELLRKISGQPVVADYIGAIQKLAGGGGPAGARLLAAFLNVATPGERLVPVVRSLASSRRYHGRLMVVETGLGPLQNDWLKRLVRAEAKAKICHGELDLPAYENDDKRPGNEHPWPLLRCVFGHLLDQVLDETFWAEDQWVELLADIMRLEVDGWQERISNLAGIINPFKVESVARVLPILNRADSEIRDLRQMTNWVMERDFESAFVRPLARWRETLDEKDWDHLLRDLASEEEFAGLARLAHGLAARPMLLSQLAAGTQRIMALSECLVAEGVRDTSLDMFTSCVLAQSHFANGQIVFAIEKELAETIEGVLPEAGDIDHPLSGLMVIAGLLVIDLAEGFPDMEHGLPAASELSEDEEQALKAWRAANGEVDTADLEGLRGQGLALAKQIDGEEEAEDDDLEVQDLGASALKHLVLTNIQSVSVLLGFLRNPKVTSIPGLVEDVVNRTRNPQIIATIANDRVLHTGFANKGVAVACLRSPINVSIKTLRKFCHVKYVSKIELKRMANDRTGIRKEVAREIQKYLEALA